jgi:hypothetical protein
MFFPLVAALSLHAVTGWISAHPVEAFLALGAVLNLINGLLPATIRTGPVGTFLHVLLDRVVVLTRRNAPGTLKWPIVAGSILRAVADSLNPPEATVLERATVAPPEPIAPRAFDPAAHITRGELPPIDGQRGSVDLAGLVGCLVVATALGSALAGCPTSRQLTRPALGAVDGCEPRATRCAPDGRPQVCSGSRRWTDADSVCATGANVAAVCCLTRSPVTGAELHACVLAERCLGDSGAR